MKIKLAIASALTVAVALTGCSLHQSLDSGGVAREKTDDFGIFIDEQPVPLAGQFSETSVEKKKLSQDALSLCNEMRRKEGLPALSWSDSLANCAVVRAEESSLLWSHTRPDGSDWWTVNSSIMFGENLGKGYDTSSQIVDAWMNSQSHKENVMDPELKTCGIAIYEQNGVYYWAQEFGY